MPRNKFKPGPGHISITMPESRDKIAKTMRERAAQGLINNPDGRPRILEDKEGVPNELGQKVLRLYGASQSYRQIQEITGVDKSTIMRFVKRHAQ